jgi:dTDP-4-amino-4,6-dideoxygalactose transaminase
MINEMQSFSVPFNKPHIAGNELLYIRDAVSAGKISGDGKYSKLVHEWFEANYGFKKTLLTTSCTDALEMCALLLNIQPGDEVIMPAYTFVSTANPFFLRGARIIFADSYSDHPNIDPKSISELINERTKAVVVVHYAGVACDMDAILKIVEPLNIAVVEDAAQAINADYKGVALGGIGRLGTLSFHETKNIVCGEGGLLMLNVEADIKRAEVIREKGTNRSAFFRGEINKYGWVDVGSSFLPSDILAAYLYAQLERKDLIQEKRTQLWRRYNSNLQITAEQGYFELPNVPTYAGHNSHIFYIVCRTVEERSNLIEFLKSHGVYAAFHYQSLHLSEFFIDQHDGRPLKNSQRFTDALVRLPLYHELALSQVDQICDLIETKAWVVR